MPRKKRARRSFTAEFKADAVKLVQDSGKSVGQIAKDLDLTETALREWVRRAEGTRSTLGSVAALAVAMAHSSLRKVAIAKGRLSALSSRQQADEASRDACELLSKARATQGERESVAQQERTQCCVYSGLQEIIDA